MTGSMTTWGPFMRMPTSEGMMTGIDRGEEERGKRLPFPLSKGCF
jgi:hypothetical protein